MYGAAVAAAPGLVLPTRKYVTANVCPCFRTVQPRNVREILRSFVRMVNGVRSKSHRFPLSDLKIENALAFAQLYNASLRRTARGSSAPHLERR